MRYKIGLDVGIASVGWAVVELDDDGNPKRVADLGVRTFDAAENPKDGSSLTLERREARGARRTLRRKKIRVEKAKKLFLKTLLTGEEDISKNFDKLYNEKENVYELRVRALDEKLSGKQLAKIFLAMIKRRGYKSNSKSEDLKDKESGKVLSALLEHKKEFNGEEEKYRTVGEYLFKDLKFYDNVGSLDKQEVFVVRNKSGEYRKTLLRSWIEDEIKFIFESQRNHGNEKMTAELEKRFLEIFNSQIDFDSGPNHPSPYRTLYNVGKCTLEDDEKRAPKGSWIFTSFNFLQKLNNLKITDDFSNEFVISDENREELVELFKSKKDISFKDIRKKINVGSEYKFNFLNYSAKVKKDKEGNEIIEDPENKKFLSNTSFEILKALDMQKKPVNTEMVDDIAYILSMYKTDDNRIKNFEEKGIVLDKEIFNKVLSLKISNFGFLSIKAMRKLLPFMKMGQRYDQACKSAGYNHSKFDSLKSDKINVNEEETKNRIKEITSPVVKRSVHQTIKIVNAIILKYGKPEGINIELAREMSKNWSERLKIKKQQEEREKNNQAYIDKLADNGILLPSGKDILKMRLYEEQGGKCMYSLKSLISKFGDLRNAFRDNNTQIDHIIPFSKSFDDSLNNKVLVITSENQNKKNRLPFEYFGNDKERWEEFVSNVNTLRISNKKKQNLLKQAISAEEERELGSRALNDTRYISRFLMNLYSDKLLFSENAKKRAVVAVNGSMTSYLRKIWGLNKNRKDSDIHHAQDAVVVACASNSMIQKVSRFLQYNRHNVLLDGRVYSLKTGEVFENEYIYLKQLGIRYPYENFARELKALMREDINHLQKELKDLDWNEEEIRQKTPVFISRMPTRKLKGRMHKDTIKSTKILNVDKNKKIYTQKTALAKLELDNNDEIKDYPEIYKNSDRVLYDGLKKRLIETRQKIENGELVKKSSQKLGEIAFAEPFYKQAKEGRKANQVKSVKIQSVSSGGVVIGRGFVENSNIIRTDIFFKDKKYFAVPVYTSDFYIGKLPNKAIAAGKAKEDWPEMSEEYEFKFSLYPNDLIRLKKKSGIIGSTPNKNKVKVNDELLYYNGVDSSTAGISFFKHDKSIKFTGIGIKSGVEIFEKYQVDLLGNVSKVNKEKRMGFNINKN